MQDTHFSWSLSRCWQLHNSLPLSSLLQKVCDIVDYGGPTTAEHTNTLQVWVEHAGSVQHARQCYLHPLYQKSLAFHRLYTRHFKTVHQASKHCRQPQPAQSTGASRQAVAVGLLTPHVCHQSSHQRPSMFNSLHLESLVVALMLLAQPSAASSLSFKLVSAAWLLSIRDPRHSYIRLLSCLAYIYDWSLACCTMT